jgi:hypothetical protein
MAHRPPSVDAESITSTTYWYAYWIRTSDQRISTLVRELTGDLGVSESTKNFRTALLNWAGSTLKASVWSVVFETMAMSSVPRSVTQKKRGLDESSRVRGVLFRSGLLRGAFQPYYRLPIF